MVLEGFGALSMGASSVIVEVISVDKFSLQYRLPIVLQLAKDPKICISDSYLPVHLLHRVPTMIIQFV